MKLGTKIKIDKEINENISILNNENNISKNKPYRNENISILEQMSELENEQRRILKIMGTHPELQNEFDSMTKEILELEEKMAGPKAEHWSALLEAKYTIDTKRKIVKFETGEKYTMDEIDLMIVKKYGPKDVQLLHAFKTDFAVKLVTGGALIPTQFGWDYSFNFGAAV